MTLKCAVMASFDHLRRIMMMAAATEVVDDVQNPVSGQGV